MPIGCFVILLPKDQDYEVLGYYFINKSIKFEVNSNIFLRLNLDHEKNEFNYLKLKDFFLLSYLHKIKGKKSRKISGLLVGLLLSQDEAPEKFQDLLKNAAVACESLDLLNIKQDEFEDELASIYREHLESTKDLMNPALIKTNVINRTKEMLSGGKKNRNTAQDLLELIEQEEHVKVAQFHKMAEEALEINDYEKAGKMYARAAEIAESLLEEELAQLLNQKATNSSKIPELTKSLEKTVQLARNYLKSEEFDKASRAYKNASDIAKKLMNPDREEEYSLKSKALYDFHQADQRFNKK